MLVKTLIRGWIFTSLLLLAAGQTWAVIETYEFSSPELEQRYRDLSAELRCPKCQNQNIADSNAPISRDLRELLHRQLEAGASDEQIRDYMVARYGEFVRYRPRFGGVTTILWLAPLALLVAAVAVAFLSLRSGRRRAAAPGLSEAEQQQLRAMLDEREREQ